jgi:glycerophosphoryl diester phosphodiesterase
MRILAHRGACGYAPENTFASFELGVSMNAHALETDVRMTRDATLVLIHDPTLDRTTTGTGAVADIDYHALSALDAGIKFDPKFAGEKVPRVADFLARFAGRIPVCLEVKIPAAVDPLAALIRQQQDLDVEFTSFEWAIAQHLKELLPTARIGHLTRGFDHAEIERVRAAGLTSICPPAKDVTADLVAHAHNAGLLVRTWGTKSREQLAHIKSCHVDGTTLNHPDWGTTE